MHLLSISLWHGYMVVTFCLVTPDLCWAKYDKITVLQKSRFYLDNLNHIYMHDNKQTYMPCSL